jgi:hypothetical protein
VIAKNLPGADVVTEGPQVVIHWGWRENGDDSAVEVARWVADEKLVIPDWLSETMVSDDGGLTGSILMPPAILAGIDRVETMQSEIDTNFDTVRAMLVDWLKANPGTIDPTSRLRKQISPAGGWQDARHPTSREGDELTVASVSMWKNPKRMERLVFAWREADDIAGTPDSDTLDALWDWLCAYRHTYQQMSHVREKALNRRDDLYRNVAFVLADQAQMVGVDSMNIAQIAAKTSESELPDSVVTPGSRRRAYAAPGTLRQLIASACKRDGVTVVDLDPAFETRTHHQCGHTNPQDLRWMNLHVVCDGCGDKYDQNENALAHLGDRMALAA